MNTNKSVSQELHRHLDRTVDRILEGGTRPEAPTLMAMAEAARQLKPGAAAALIDWDGSEVARLRAFGIVHGVLVRDLPSDAQAYLLTRLRGGFADDPAARSGAVLPPERRDHEQPVGRRHPVAELSGAMPRSG